MYRKGAIVLIPFPFTDLSAHKVRPAVILSENSGSDDVIVAFISSGVRKLRVADVSVKRTDDSFTKTGLKTDSVIKTEKIATLSKKIVLGELGRVSPKTEKQIAVKLKRLLQL